MKPGNTRGQKDKDRGRNLECRTKGWRGLESIIVARILKAESMRRRCQRHDKSEGDGDQFDVNGQTPEDLSLQVT
jgi:hypothetical protein